MLDFGKYKYQQTKKEHDAKKKQHVVKVKEIKIRPQIEEHDYNVKLDSALNFLEKGNKVKMTLVFKGRELAHKEIGEAVLKKFCNEVVDSKLGAMESEGKIAVWNKAAEEITGYSPVEVVGSRDIWKKLYPDSEYRRTVTRQITEIISTKSYFANFDTRIRTKAGETRVISWNTRQIGDDGEHYAIAIGRDITEQKKAEEALLAYMTEMAMRIKQPVGIVRDNLLDIAQLIRDGKLSPDEIAMLLDAQVRNAAQIASNVQEFQKAILEKNSEIPEAYRKFLEG